MDTTLISSIFSGESEKKTEDDRVPSILEADKSSKEYRKNWTRLIQKIYEAAPLTCPKYGGNHGDLSALNQHGSGLGGYVLDHFSQLPMNDDHLCRDPDCPLEAYLRS